MKKVVKLQKEINNDLGDKEKLDLLIAIDNVRLIQYTCPSNEFFSVSHKDLIVYKEDDTLKISKNPINKDVIAVLTWFKYKDTKIIKLFIKDSSEIRHAPEKEGNNPQRPSGDRRDEPS